MELNQNRNEIRELIAITPAKLMERNYNFPDYEKDSQHLKELEYLIDMLEKIFLMDEQSIQNILGGEIKSSSPFNSEDMPVPLYLYIDIMINSIEKNMSSTKDLDKIKNSLIDRLKKLREKSAKLEYDKIFDPNKSLDETIKEKIARSKGNYRFRVTEINGEKYIELHTTIVSESYTNIGGDIYDLESYKTYSSNLAFKEDILNEKNKLQRKIEEICTYISHYFIEGKVPKTNISIFYDSLIDISMDSNILYYLHELVEAVYKGKQINELEEKLMELKRAEVFSSKKKVEEAVTQEKTVESKTQDAKKTKKQGIFSRLRDARHKNNSSIGQESGSVETFERERQVQIDQDKEVRNVVIYQRRIVDGKEELVPLNNDEYMVVRR